MSQRGGGKVVHAVGETLLRPASSGKLQSGGGRWLIYVLVMLSLVVFTR
jgi:hypothetical protein